MQEEVRSILPAQRLLTTNENENRWTYVVERLRLALTPALSLREREKCLNILDRLPSPSGRGVGGEGEFQATA
jgi:hypothetical protein